MSSDQAASDLVNALLTQAAENLIDTLRLDMTVEELVETLDQPIKWAPLEYTRMEDREHPGRLCAWCFLPRNHPDCDFAKGHTPYRELFSGQSS